MSESGDAAISQLLNSPQFKDVAKAAEDAANVALGKVLERQGKPSVEAAAASAGGGHSCFSLLSVIMTRAESE
ncbi:hypothetical protein [Streptomyces sp. LS1784]|uniref:hypothetical protein n=1 Tax=Streptomyces sp. LS1784 TaxID=2851533 RepID=UPI001CC95EEB|nr:hypothetical protein [Streptomyces sp. LS1784]